MKLTDFEYIYSLEMPRLIWQYQKEHINKNEFELMFGTIRHLLMHVEEIDIEIKPASKRFIKTHTRYSKRVASSWDVAMNKAAYGIDIEAGKEYDVVEKPWGILQFNGKRYAIFSDDPGQCDMFYLDNDEPIFGYAYDFYPQLQFIYEIISYECRKVILDKEGE